MSKPSIVFHHPLPLADEPTSGSQVRPVRMVEAFRTLGYHVEEVTGYGRERRQAVKRVKRRMAGGTSFAFAYAESSTMPTLLTEPHHVPTHPFLDFGFFSHLRKHRVPIGLFYRDVYWTFELYDQKISWPKRTIAKAFYRYDWARYKSLLNHLFVPAESMRQVLPSAWPAEKLSALPPGCEISDASSRTERRAEGPLRLFYVGGIKPPLYDINPLLSIAVNDLRDARLVVCCRKEEWNLLSPHYPLASSRKVQVVHAHSDELAAYYGPADLFIDVRNAHNYMSFTIPIKIFEALGYALPVITKRGTEAARFIEREGAGWVFQDQREARQLVSHLNRNREVITRKREHLMAIRQRHTWGARAKEAARILVESSKRAI